MSTKAYDPATEHDSLFDIGSGGGLGMNEAPARPEKAVTSALCPECLAPRGIGLFRQGEHLVWRLHDRITVGGSRMPCRAGGAPICDTGTRDGKTLSGATCRHPT